METPALLTAWRSGDMRARDRLIALFYPELRHAAAAMLRRERGNSLSTRDLVNEAVARLVGLNRIAWEDKAHVMALASTMMRRTLIDHARARLRHKRDHQQVTLHTGFIEEPRLDAADLGDALARLERIAPDCAEVVEMRYFGGMELGEIAYVLGCSESTVKRRWTAARLWLVDALA